MNYIRQTIDGDKLAGIFDLPHNLHGKKVEVIIRPAPIDIDTAVYSNSSYGCLRKYANPLLISQESGAWEEVVLSKYADN